MQEIIKKELCSGCHACFNICPKQCIEMISDDDGFWYPRINENECVNCNKCNEVCPVLNKSENNDVGKAYAAINQDEKIRSGSSSGGIFTLLADYIIDRNGVVFGAAFDDEFNVTHIAVDCKDDLHKLRGSKYAQSKIGDTYKQAKRFLDTGKWVLFSGTPCQISGIKSYLGKNYEKLITQDIICHGVPSPMIWQKYIKCREKISESQVKRISFRNKKQGWKTYSVSVKFANNTEYIKRHCEDSYMKAFLKNLSLRPSCYNCHSKSLERESDITLADFWGCADIVSDMDDDKGLSLVFVNSIKGKQIFEGISDKTEYREVDIHKAVQYNPSACVSVPQNKKRDKFFVEIKNSDFEKTVNKFTKNKTIKRVLSKLKRIIKRMCNYVQK